MFVYLAAGTVAHFAHLSNLGLYGVAQVGLIIVVSVLLTAMGWWRAVGFRRPDDWADLRYFAVPLVPLVINLIPGVAVTTLRHLALVLAIALMVGFVEEAFFRGLMLNSLRAKGLWRAVIVTSLLFGLTHAMNMLAGRSAIDAASQIFYATAIGFAYAALVVKRGIIWPLVLAHSLIDFTNFIQRPGFAFSPGWALAITVGVGFVFTAYGLFVMLRVPQPPCGGTASS